jgi:hypothetical protein
MKFCELASVYECERCGYKEIIMAGDQPSDYCPECEYDLLSDECKACLAERSDPNYGGTDENYQ